MSLGLREQARQRQQRFWLRLLKAALLLTAMGGVGLFTFQMGVEYMKSRQVGLVEDQNQLRRELEDAQRNLVAAREALRIAETRAADAEARLEREQAQGEQAQLSKLLADRLAAGVSADRLAFLIREAKPTRNCEPPEIKKLIVATSNHRGTQASVGPAGNAITINGEGTAVTANGQPQAWFDPQKPVTFRFSAPSGRNDEARGVLPLTHTMVVGTTEHRFRIAVGVRSFAEITVERCPFP